MIEKKIEPNLPEEDTATWKRLEAGLVDDNLEEGLEARIADPLWMLARQWQVGEFHGEDAASPVFIEAEVETTPISHFRSGNPSANNPVYRRNTVDVPLEAFVERESIARDSAHYRRNAEAGMLLLRVMSNMLKTINVRELLRKSYPLELPADDKTQQLLAMDQRGLSELTLLFKRSVDADKILQEINANADAETWLKTKVNLGEDAGIISKVARVVEQWKSEWETMFSVPELKDIGSWNSHRMEYRFQVGAGIQGNEIQLDAAEYHGGRLDWEDFDLDFNPKSPLGVENRSTTKRLIVLPGFVSYAGMPANRWWEIEDNKVWFGDVDTAPEDLARSVIASFATVFSNDWFLVPCTLRLGTIARVKRLRVHDNYGEIHKVRSCAEYDGKSRNWRYFELTGDQSADADELKGRSCPWLMLPPVVHDSLKSRPIESINLIRDEASNLAWGIESVIQSPSGRRIDRKAAWRATIKEKPEASEQAWHYLLANDVPDHFVPLIPIKAKADGSILLQRGRIADTSVRGKVRTRGALGKILEPDKALLIHEEEVPNSGVRIQRHWQLARDPNGKPHLWLGRHKGPIDHRRNSSLCFDDLITETDD